MLLAIVVVSLANGYPTPVPQAWYAAPTVPSGEFGADAYPHAVLEPRGNFRDVVLAVGPHEQVTISCLFSSRFESSPTKHNSMGELHCHFSLYLRLCIPGGFGKHLPKACLIALIPSPRLTWYSSYCRPEGTEGFTTLAIPADAAVFVVEASSSAALEQIVALFSAEVGVHTLGGLVGLSALVSTDGQGWHNS
jgi:hypothetical protein